VAKQHKPKRKAPRPAQPPAAEPLDPELRAILDGFREIARESPGGWGTVAEAARDVPPEILEEVIPLLGRHLASGALPLLRGLALEENEALALPAVKSLPLLGTRAAGEALVEAFHAHPEGDVARAAWEGVQALQARGIRVDLPEPDGVRRVVPAYTMREVYSSFPDGVGTRSAMVRLQDRYGIWHALGVAWNDQVGVKDGFLLPMSPREFREITEGEGAMGMELVPAPLEFVQWEVARGRALNSKSRFPLEDHLDDWDALIGPPPEGYEPPDPGLEGRNFETDLETLDDLDLLLDHRATWSWAVEPADCRPWRERWLKLQDAPEDDPAYDTLLAEVAERLITPDQKGRYVSRLVDAARKLVWDEEPELAEIALAAAAVTQAVGSPSESPFLLALIDNTFAMLEDMLEAGEDPEALRYDPMQPVD
jgi:hypothetical protein